MKTILISLMIGTFAFAGGAVAGKVGEQFAQGKMWGFVKGNNETRIYVVEDRGGKCYLAEISNGGTLMDCVK